MSEPLVYTQPLKGGGSITVKFELDWLSAPIEDCMFVRGLYDTFKAYPSPIEPVATSAPTSNPVTPKVETVKKSTGGAGRPATVDFTEVSAIAEQARADGKPMAESVAAHYGITVAAAQSRIKKARKRGDLTAGRDVAKSSASIGWDGPKPSRPHDPAPLVEKVYRCECGEQVATENELAKHTMSHHGRPPRATEQTRVAAA